MSRGLKLAFAALIFSFIAIMFILCVAIRWRYHDYKPLIVYGNAKTTQATYHPGDSVEYVVHYCKYVNIPATVERTLVNGSSTTIIDAIKRNIPQGCGFAHSVLILSDTTTSGTYHAALASTYQVSPLQQQTIIYRTNDFAVVADDGDSQTTTTTTTTTSNYNSNASSALQGAAEQVIAPTTATTSPQTNKSSPATITLPILGIKISL